MSLTRHEMQLLMAFASIYGRRWKSKLRLMWETGDYSGINAVCVPTLQRLRNSERFGPKGLKKFTVTIKEPTSDE